MNNTRSFTRRQKQEDARVYKTVIGFVYAPLVLLLGAGAAISL